MRLERRKTVIEAVDLEQVTRLADSLSPTEKRRLIAHRSGQIEIAPLGGTPGVDPPDKTEAGPGARPPPLLRSKARLPPARAPRKRQRRLTRQLNVPGAARR